MEGEFVTANVIDYQVGKAKSRKNVKSIPAMKRIRFIFGVFLAASSLGSRPTLPKHLPQPPQNSTQARIAEALRRAKRLVDSNGRGLSMVRDPGRNVEGFKVEEVIQGVNKGRDLLLDQLNGSELAALRLYVENFYPAASMSTLETKESTAGLLVTSESKSRAFSKASSFIAGLRSKFGGFGAQDSDLSVDLNVTSEPDQALLSLVAGREKRETRTNNRMPNVFRGLYEYTITKSGFKTGTGQINLIDDDGLSIQCSLVASNDSGESFCKQVRTF